MTSTGTTGAGTTRVALGIDAGGSSTRWLAMRLAPDGATACQTRGVTSALSALAFLDPHAATRATATLRTLIDEALAAVGVADATACELSIVAGMTGLSEDTTEAKVIEDAFRTAAAGRAITHLDVVNDMALAYHAVLAPGEGLLVYAGTGSIAVHVSADGALHRAGGYGYRIDDAGGGYWLGRAALQAMLRDLDRRGNFLRNPFTTDLLGHIGHDDWPGIKRWAYGADRAPIASLARIVLAHAGDDPLARQLVHDAAAELIALAGRLRVRTGVTTWVASGGLLAADNELRRALQASAPDDVKLRFHEPDFATAALTRAAAVLH